MSNVINLFDFAAKARQQEADELAEDVIDDILETSLYTTKQVLAILCEEGFDVYNEEHAHDIALLVEAIKGLTYNTAGVRFPTQHLSRILFEIPSKEEFVDSFID